LAFGKIFERVEPTKFQKTLFFSSLVSVS